MDAQFVRACSRLSDLPADEHPEVAVAGRSNCGKSSLLNALSQHKHLARTSSKPGRTRQIMLFRLKLSALTLQLADLPGYGFARVSKQLRRDWGVLIESYLERRANLRLILLLNDIRRSPAGEERDLVEWAAQLELPMLLVLTKADKLNKSERHVALQQARKLLKLDTPPLAVSTRDSASIEALRSRLVEHPAVRASAAPRDLAATNQ
jgi:GTP-binding protein